MRMSKTRSGLHYRYWYRLLQIYQLGSGPLPPRPDLDLVLHRSSGAETGHVVPLFHRRLLRLPDMRPLPAQLQPVPHHSGELLRHAGLLYQDPHELVRVGKMMSDLNYFFFCLKLVFLFTGDDLLAALPSCPVHEAVFRVPPPAVHRQGGVRLSRDRPRQGQGAQEAAPRPLLRLPPRRRRWRPLRSRILLAPHLRRLRRRPSLLLAAARAEGPLLLPALCRHQLPRHSAASLLRPHGRDTGPDRLALLRGADPEEALGPGDGLVRLEGGPLPLCHVQHRPGEP